MGEYCNDIVSIETVQKGLKISQENIHDILRFYKNYALLWMFPMNF